MSLSSRDRKLVLAIVPIALILGYWFLLLSPKREEAAKAGTEVAEQQTRLQKAEAKAQQAATAQTTFASDYSTTVRLGKAIPVSVDMPSLLVQLDRSSRGTGITFQEITPGERAAASAPAAAGATPPAAGAAPSGGAAPAAAAPAGAAAAPAGGAPNATTPASSTSAAPGLESVPIETAFEGEFFDLADLFHRMKRFVRSDEESVAVRGRLLTVDGFAYEITPAGLKATITMTAYLTPKGEGATAGASPESPTGGQPASSSTPPASSTPAATPPTATATP